MHVYSKTVITTFILAAIVFKVCLADSNNTDSSNSSLVEERIITDIDDVLNGVPIDLRYNQSSHKHSIPPGNLPSVPGCPKSDEGYPWVYYGSPPKCYLAGQRGPCDIDERIFIQYQSPCGICNCNCFEGVTRSNEIEDQFCDIPDGTEFVLMAALGKCYRLYDQGPCDKDKWIVKLVKNTRRGVITRAVCETRTCPPTEIPSLKDGKRFCVGRKLAFSGAVGIISNSGKELIMLKFDFAKANKTASLNSSLVEERIITDIEDVENGVLVDFNYNETSFSLSPGALSSVPGCPKSDEGVHRSNKIEDQFCEIETEILVKFAFMAALGKCFRIYDQGPCDEEEWLVKTVENTSGRIIAKVMCERRTCPPRLIPLVRGGPSFCVPPVPLFENSGGFEILSHAEEECKASAQNYSKLLKKCVDKFDIKF
ncbi:unnamed protein product [Orchesella dallaii]|uniref:DUF4789 domain-containing protein n=1 Tax=Orchesella dallaii TaxID=48710 RepID=A0ABP1Q6S9_9HEXA